MKADQEVGFASAVIAEGKTLAGSPTAIDLPPRAVPVSHGRTILIRPVRAQDEADLSNLYDGLDVNDRYLRFFSAYRPSPEFIRKLANPAPGEARVVAELNEAGETRLVAEAGYSLLTNGNGEFAMVVARDWRGWLGPYLLDVVIELAAANRVPNLEAEVLTMNRSMLALLRARGCVLLSHDGWTEFRLMVGTGRQGATWPNTDERPHVLVETPDGRWPLEDAAEAAGIRVITCTGPSENHPCPVLSGHECALVAGADAIVVRNTSHKAIWETLARSHTSSHSDIPVVIDPVGDHTQAIPLDDVRVPASFHFYLQTARRSGAACSRA